MRLVKIDKNYINPEHVTLIQESTEFSGTVRIYLSDDCIVLAKGTLEDVVKALLCVQTKYYTLEDKEKQY